MLMLVCVLLMCENIAMIDIPRHTVDQPRNLVDHGRSLSYEIEKARKQYEALLLEYAQLPPEILAELAWMAVAWYHGGDGVATRLMHGTGSEQDLSMRRIADQRLAALPDDESREKAIKEANAWLDDNFSE